jgi:hypothetical protein
MRVTEPHNSGLELTFFASSLAFLTVLRRSSAVNYPMLIMTCLLCESLIVSSSSALLIPDRSSKVAGSTSHFAHDIYGCVSSFVRHGFFHSLIVLLTRVLGGQDPNCRSGSFSAGHQHHVQH